MHFACTQENLLPRSADRLPSVGEERQPSGLGQCPHQDGKPGARLSATKPDRGSRPRVAEAEGEYSVPAKLFDYVPCLLNGKVSCSEGRRFRGAGDQETVLRGMPASEFPVPLSSRSRRASLISFRRRFPPHGVAGGLRRRDVGNSVPEFGRAACFFGGIAGRKLATSPRRMPIARSSVAYGGSTAEGAPSFRAKASPRRRVRRGLMTR